MIETKTTTEIDDTIRLRFNIMTTSFENGHGNEVSAMYLYDQYRAACEALKATQAQLEELQEATHWSNR